MNRNEIPRLVERVVREHRARSRPGFMPEGDRLRSVCLCGAEIIGCIDVPERVDELSYNDAWLVHRTEHLVAALLHVEVNAITVVRDDQ